MRRGWMGPGWLSAPWLSGREGVESGLESLSKAPGDGLGVDVRIWGT